MCRLIKKSSVVGLFCITLLGPAINLHAQQAQKAAESTGASPGVQEMQKIADHWSEAVNKRDQFGLELVLSPAFIGISSTGEVTTRNQQITKLFVKGELPLTLQRKVISARFLNDVAIVNGTYDKHWKTEGGPLEEKGVYSQVFEHVRGNWLCINYQETVVAEKSKEAKAEHPRSKTTNADLPLHIPLVYKGPSSTQAPPAAGSKTNPN